MCRRVEGGRAAEVYFEPQGIRMTRHKGECGHSGVGGDCAGVLGGVCGAQGAGCRVQDASGSDSAPGHRPCVRSGVPREG